MAVTAIDVFFAVNTNQVVIDYSQCDHLDEMMLPVCRHSPFDMLVVINRSEIPVRSQPHVKPSCNE